MPLVGLTGGMGAGKSTALRLLGELGAETLSTDAVVHELYGDPRVREAVVRRWGAEVAPEGVVDRGRVAAIAFASEDDRAWLEQLLWPLVGERMAQWIVEVRAPVVARPAGEQADGEARVEGSGEGRGAPKAAVIEVPLLFEAGMEGGFDATIAVVADERLRGERTRDRDHASAAERHARQLSQEEKAQRATFVVRNDGTVDDMRHSLAAILAKLSG